MGDSFDHRGSRKGSEVANVINNKNISERCLVASSPTPGLRNHTRNTVPFNHNRMSGTAGDAALFLLKVAALETLRRFSKARCPVVWCGIQALQALCYTPLKWIQRWAPLKGLISSMQTLSRPLLVLSIATAFSDQPRCCNINSDAVDDSQGVNDSEASSESNSELPLVQSTLDTSVLAEAPQSRKSSTNWLFQLYEELEKQGISLPERINEDELHRFYIAAKFDLPCLLSSVKKTIVWRKTFCILSRQELEMWSNMVFWHGVDVNYRPCLIVRLGLAFSSLSPRERPLFLQAVVSQVEHGILHLLDPGNPRITVLVDCQGLSPLRFPMQMMRSCFSIFQEHFPDRLGFVFVIRVPPVVRVIAHTVIKVLKPVTREKLKLVGEMYQKILTENFQTLPSYLGGSCTCVRCSNRSICSMKLRQTDDTSETERKSDVDDYADLPSPRQSNLTDMHMNGNCDHALRASVISVLVFWVLIAFVAQIYNPENSRPALPL